MQLKAEPGKPNYCRAFMCSAMSDRAEHKPWGQEEWGLGGAGYIGDTGQTLEQKLVK